MKILAIETSCDDTAIAILKVSDTREFDVLANVIASQIEVHQKYGGVFPAMAKREHQKNILPSLIEALEQSNLLKKEDLSENFPNAKKPDIEKILEREPDLLKKIIPFFKKYKKPEVDYIAVTNGPGLEPCLWVGVNFAKALSYFWNIPVIPVNHVESHILVNFLENPKIKFPAVALTVSGGHTQITLVKGIGKYKILGETRDDAAGECFDKCAKILGLGYPGGPIISKLASQAVIPSLTGNPGLTSQNLDSRFRGNNKFLPRPMIGTKDYDFSFSGLKTAVLYAWQKGKKENGRFFGSSKKTTQLRAEFSAEIQQAIIDVLIKKTMKAVKDFKAKSLILGGGVSANQELRKQIKAKLEKPFGVAQGGESPNVEFFVPIPSLSTDNAVMTAITGFYHRKETVNWQKIQLDSNLRMK